MYSDKNMLKHDKFWRGKLHASVIDLRDNAVPQRLRTSRDVIEDSRHQRQTSSLPDEYYAQEYISALQQRNTTVNKSSLSTPSDEQPITREQVVSELAYFDTYDLAIQEHLPKNSRPPRRIEDPLRPVSVGMEPRSSSGEEPAALRSLAVPVRSFTQRRNERGSDLDYELSDWSLRAQQDTTTAVGWPARQSLGAGGRWKKWALLLFFVSILSVTIILGFRTSALKDSITTSAQNAYVYMQEGRNAMMLLDADKAHTNFSRAIDEFSQIENSFGFVSRGILNASVSLPIYTKLTSAANLVRAGKLFSYTGYEASLALLAIDQVRESTDSIGSRLYLTDAIINAADHLDNAEDYIREANIALAHVIPSDIPAEFQEDIMSIAATTREIEDLFSEARISMDVLLTFLGHKESKTYLLIFQNSSELRATGGFIGTYGLLTLKRGNIDKIFVEGIYYPDGQLSVDVIPPRPLMYVTDKWGMRDANWFFDFPTSAEQIIWFYERTGGETPDGVIAFTPSVVKKFLALVGPIDMPQYQMTLSSDNFLELVQQEVEEDYDKELNRPKQILADLVPHLLERIQNYRSVADISDILLESLKSRDIMIYSRDTDVREFVESYNFGGRIISKEFTTESLNDYLAVVISNIGGWKTDEYTETEIDTSTSIEPDGSILRTVIIRRSHSGGSTPYKWYNKPNNAYVRIYVPLGSSIVAADGFSDEPPLIQTDYAGLNFLEDPLLAQIGDSLYKDEVSNTDIYEESGQTVFGNWMRVNPSDQIVASITYKLPYLITSEINNYQLVIQKQSGLNAQYSGSITETNVGLQMSTCKLAGSRISQDHFEFLQTEDAIINCKIIQ